jgi:hypothetical protein
VNFLNPTNESLRLIQYITTPSFEIVSIVVIRNTIVRLLSSTADVY